jgi:hypothetical protein
VLLGATLVTAGATLVLSLSSNPAPSRGRRDQDVALSLSPKGVWLGGNF